MHTDQNRRVRRSAALLLLAAAACDGGTGIDGPLPVSVGFRVTSAAAPASAAPSRVEGQGPMTVAGPPLVLSGTNGTLTLEEILIVINEVELKPADGDCTAAQSDDSCPEFEAPPRLLDLPLDGNPIDAVTALIPAGTYKELDFEIEDLEDDESDPAEAAAVAAVRSQILALVPDWPDEASALVRGTFTPTGGTAVDFRVFLKAEIEIEMELVPNLVVDDAGAPSRDLTVDVSPQIWFGRSDGSVVDLSAHDFDATGQLLEFEVEMEDGFTEIEVHGS